MKFLTNLFAGKNTPKQSKFSDFFLHESEKKKIEVLNEAARKANKDQQEIFRRATLKSKS